MSRIVKKKLHTKCNFALWITCLIPLRRARLDYSRAVHSISRAIIESKYRRKRTVLYATQTAASWGKKKEKHTRVVLLPFANSVGRHEHGGNFLLPLPRGEAGEVSNREHGKHHG